MKCGSEVKEMGKEAVDGRNDSRKKSEVLETT